VTLFTGQSAFADDEARVRMLPLSLSESRISGLTWDQTEDLLVYSRSEGPSKTEYFVVLKGYYAREDWKLLIGNGKKVLIPKGEFYIEVVLNQVETPLTVIAMNSKDHLEEEMSGLGVVAIGRRRFQAQILRAPRRADRMTIAGRPE